MFRRLIFSVRRIVYNRVCNEIDVYAESIVCGQLGESSAGFLAKLSYHNVVYMMRYTSNA